ncbi:MAG: ABC transporter ATP-binding protein [Oscillospiraceae bacterium]|nr:ABC transporter ATP-binding protein [Oscillospiraceae bacterium]
MARNKFDIDEKLESEFSFKHLKKSGKYIRMFSGRMVLALFLLLTSSFSTMLLPLITQHILDITVPNKDMKELIILSAIYISLVVLMLLLNMAYHRIMVKVSQGIVFHMRQDLYEHLQKLPFSYYDDRPHGKILVRVVQYINNVSDMLSNGILGVILEVFNLIFITIFMFILDSRLAWFVIAGLPVLLIIILATKPAQRKAWQDVSNKNSNLNAYLQESINGVKITQTFTRQEKNYSIFTNLCEAARKVWIKAVYIGNFIGNSVPIISRVVASMIYIGGILWLSPAVTFGTIMGMTSYADRFWQPISNLANIYNNLINTLAYLERIFETLDEPVVIEDVPDAVELPPIKGDVEFRNVVFSYDESKIILNNVSFTVKAGESVALVGPTGAGKSTVVNLLSRFYNLNSGQILVDGYDISKIKLNSLRSQMGIMLQDSFIFSGTVDYNIRYGKQDATEEEIIAASEAVHVHDFVKEMKDGYNTELNERGSRLSQGQKQLISFARTLISDPRILVLDEATSSIDTQTEVYVQEGIARLLEGRTSFIIAHRLSTIRNCDKIMYIDNQNIVEAGTHDELMAKKGAYYALYTARSH